MLIKIFEVGFNCVTLTTRLPSAECDVDKGTVALDLQK